MLPLPPLATHLSKKKKQPTSSLNCPLQIFFVDLLLAMLLMREFQDLGPAMNKEQEYISVRMVCNMEENLQIMAFPCMCCFQTLDFLVYRDKAWKQALWSTGSALTSTITLSCTLGTSYNFCLMIANASAFLCYSILGFTIVQNSNILRAHFIL